MIQIIGTGSYLPEKVLSNHDLEKMVDTTDEWIVTRTGIKQRRIASSDQAASDLAVAAAKKAINNANISPDDIDLVIVATITPDMLFPSTACIVQSKLGIKNAAVFDIGAACTGFIYGLSVAHQFLQNGSCKTALVIASEVLSKITDWEDRNTCVLFGDGSGAAILQKSNTEDGFLSFYLGADGQYIDLLKMPAGGSRIPATIDTVQNRMHYLKMIGNEVFKIAVQSMLESANIALNQCGLTCEDVNLVIPHQANIRIIKALAKRMRLAKENIFMNIEKYGNMSAATIAVGLDEAMKSGRIKKGDIIELVAFGAGFTKGACVIRW